MEKSGTQQPQTAPVTHSPSGLTAPTIDPNAPFSRSDGTETSRWNILEPEDSEHKAVRDDDRMSLLSSDLEMEDMEDGRTRVHDEETGLRHTDDVEEELDAQEIARAGAEAGYRNFIRKAISNFVLIALWYLFSITISVVSSHLSRFRGFD